MVLKKVGAALLVLTLSAAAYGRELHLQPADPTPAAQSTGGGRSNVVPALLISAAVIALVGYLWSAHSHNAHDRALVRGKV